MQSFGSNQLDSIIAAGNLALATVCGQTSDYPPQQAKSQLTQWGVPGTHLSGDFSQVGNSQTIWYEFEVDLNTMVVSNLSIQ